MAFIFGGLLLTSKIKSLTELEYHDDYKTQVKLDTKYNFNEIDRIVEVLLREKIRNNASMNRRMDVGEFVDRWRGSLKEN